MKFVFLYNGDNGMAFPWTQALADARHDLIAITSDELQSIVRNSLSIGDILNARAAKANPEVSIEVPSGAELPSETPQDAPEEPKGVVAPKGAKDAVAPVVDEFGNEQKDYTTLRGTVVPADVDIVPNEDLVRFANEVVCKDFGTPPEGDEKEVADWYDLVRNKTRKIIAKIVKNRDKRNAAKGADNGGND